MPQPPVSVSCHLREFKRVGGGEGGGGISRHGRVCPDEGPGNRKVEPPKLWHPRYGGQQNSNELPRRYKSCQTSPEPRKSRSRETKGKHEYWGIGSVPAATAKHSLNALYSKRLHLQWHLSCGSSRPEILCVEPHDVIRWRREPAVNSPPPLPPPPTSLLQVRQTFFPSLTAYLASRTQRFGIYDLEYTYLESGIIM